jgi:exosortase
VTSPGILTDLRRFSSGLSSAGAPDDELGKRIARLLPAALTTAAFVGLFIQPFVSLVKDWWSLPEAGHGLLLAPVAIWLAWRSGIRSDAHPSHRLGIALIAFAVVVRYASGLAAELFTMRASILIALVGLTVYYYGIRQIIHWWLPFVLGALAIPLPELVTQALALPLQFKASQLGTSLLQLRDIPVRLSGNVIRIPGHELFVTEACSGLRSLTALISMAVLLGALMLRHPVTRVFLLLVAIPIAVLVNGVRVFLTAFLIYFVSPEMGTGFMHTTEGWLLFIASLSILGIFTWFGMIAERHLLKTGASRE